MKDIASALVKLGGLLMVGLGVAHYAACDTGERILFFSKIIKCGSLFLILLEALKLQRHVIEKYQADAIDTLVWHGRCMWVLGGVSLLMLLVICYDAFAGINELKKRLFPEWVSPWFTLAFDVGSFAPILMFLVANVRASRSELSEKKGETNGRKFIRHLVERFTRFVDLPAVLAMSIVLVVAFVWNLYGFGNVGGGSSSIVGQAYVSGAIAFLVFQTYLAGAFVHHRTRIEDQAEEEAKPVGRLEAVRAVVVNWQIRWQSWRKGSDSNSYELCQTECWNLYYETRRDPGLDATLQ